MSGTGDPLADAYVTSRQNLKAIELMSNPCFIMCILLASVVSSGGAVQDPTVRIGADRLVAADRAGRPIEEPHLAVNPRDPRHLIVGAIVSSADLSQTDCLILTSTDGAETWNAHELGLASCGDPWGVILEDGSAVMTVLGTPPGSRSERVDLLVYRSADGGSTWPGTPVSLGANHDHQTIALDATGGPRHGTVYIVSVQDVRRETGGYFSSVFVASSRDNGKSFPDTSRVFPFVMAFNTMTPQVLTNGTLVVPFSDYSRRASDGSGSLDEERDWVLISTDGGTTFSPPYMVTGVCERSWSVLAVDRSVNHRDQLYYVCNDGDFNGVWVHRSPDGGSLWSAPTQLNRGSGRSPYARTPNIAVNSDGIVAVTFHDGRGEPGYKGIFKCQRLFVTVSTDGGENWTEESPISDDRSCPISTANGDVGMRFPQGGDYHGLAALPDGSYRTVWSDARTGVFVLRTATFRVEH